MIRFLKTVALVTLVNLTPTLVAAQQLGIHIVVAEANSAQVFSANGLDNQIDSRIGTALTFALLVHEWLLVDNPDLNQNLFDNRYPLRDMIGELHNLGLNGDRARALIAQAMRLDRTTLESAMQNLQTEIGLQNVDLRVLRTEQGAPAFNQELSLRETLMIAIAFARNHPEHLPDRINVEGDCLTFSNEGPAIVVSLVAGTSGTPGCNHAAQVAVDLNRDRLQQAFGQSR